MLDRWIALALTFSFGVLVLGCPDSRELTVDLSTDFVAGVEFDGAEVSVDGLTATRVAFSSTDRADRPRRLISRGGLAAGVHAVEVTLRLGSTRVAARRIQFLLQGSRVVHVVITRSCRDVTCPATGATECLGGVCVDPECTLLGEDGCAEAGCASHTDCMASVACAEGRCVEGACLEVPVVEACGASMVCVPERGCVEIVAPSDAGGVDSGTGPIDTGSAPIDTGPPPFDSGGPSGPYAPTAPATNSVWTVRDSPSRPITIGASDADGDIALYEVRPGGPLRGSVSFFGDTFVFTPTAGAVGTDAFTLRVSDTGGRFVDQVVSVSIVSVPSGLDWRYFAVDGESVTVGGSGEVMGTNGSQEIVVAAVPGVVTFDGSFNRGNDAVRLTGPAADWLVADEFDVGNATLTDGATFVQIPGGLAGLALVFDDGVRTLRIVDGTTLEIGTQTVTDLYLPITAPADAGSPGGIVSGVRGRMVMLAGSGSAVVGGTTELFGMVATETITVLYGDVRFDPSFNRGGDTIVFPSSATSFTASYSGSTAILAQSGLSASIPFGMVGASLRFTDCTQTLVYDGSDVRIGTQAITTAAAPLSCP